MTESSPDQETRGGPSVAEVVRRLSNDDGMDRRTRGRLLGRLAGALGASARRAGVASVTGGQWLADLLVQTAPSLSVRDLDTLREHHHGREGDSLADSLVDSATRATTGVGAAGGALAAVEYTAPATMLYAPAQIAAETLAVAAIEVKLIAELHEVYGIEVPGTGSQRGITFVHAWARRRGFDPSNPASLPRAIGPAARDQLRRRLMVRMSRNVTTLGPMFTGAVAGGVLNRQATRKLADAIRADLRQRRTDGGRPLSVVRDVE